MVGLTEDRVPLGAENFVTYALGLIGKIPDLSLYRDVKLYSRYYTDWMDESTCIQSTEPISRIFLLYDLAPTKHFIVPFDGFKRQLVRECDGLQPLASTPIRLVKWVMDGSDISWIDHLLAPRNLDDYEYNPSFVITSFCSFTPFLYRGDDFKKAIQERNDALTLLTRIATALNKISQ